MRSKNSPSGRPSFIERARREQIVGAAIATIADVGYGQASLARIAERAGISKSVISYHFDDKDELIEQVVEKIYGDSWLATEPRLEAEPTAAGKLRAFVESEIAYYAAHRERLLAVGSIVVNHRAADGSLRYPPGTQAAVVQVLVDLLRTGQDSGELGPFDPLPIAVTVSHAITGALEQWVLDPTIDLTAWCAQLVRMFECAIRAEPGSGR